MESLSGFGIIILFFILLLALLLMAHIRLRAGLSSLCRQLEEIGRGIWSWPWTAARSLCRLCAAY